MRHSFVENANHCDSTRIIVYRLMLFEKSVVFYSNRTDKRKDRIVSAKRAFDPICRTSERVN